MGNFSVYSQLAQAYSSSYLSFCVLPQPVDVVNGEESIVMRQVKADFQCATDDAQTCLTVDDKASMIQFTYNLAPIQMGDLKQQSYSL